ncbi:hypothetical protein IFM89_016573 [Coptis chinensis]|uniref:HMA domain-containing protein n=1 Tax=Coptis chinensis TaxID=261450 RepID=A0A835LYB3_9MAGN|nr:hypothetical protein IFM89_016573 [Coptis chinensis]
MIELHRSWKTRGNSKIELVTEGFYKFQFDNAAEYDHVRKNGPWLVHGFIMSIKKWKNKGKLELDPSFDLVNFWVQIFGLPSNRINEENVRKIGSSLGIVKHMDLSCSVEFKKPVARVRIKMDIKERLFKGIELRTEVGELLPVTFKYEKLEIFCYFCGRIGHDLHFCNQKDKYRVNLLMCGGSPRDIKNNFSFTLRANVFYNGVVDPTPKVVMISGTPQRPRSDQIPAKSKASPVRRSWQVCNEARAEASKIAQVSTDILGLGTRLERSVGSPGGVKSNPGTCGNRTESLGSGPISGSSSSGESLGPACQNEAGPMVLWVSMLGLNTWTWMNQTSGVDVNKVGQSVKLLEHEQPASHHSFPPLHQKPPAVSDPLPLSYEGMVSKDEILAQRPIYRFKSASTRGESVNMLASRGMRRQVQKPEASHALIAHPSQTTLSVQVGPKRKEFSDEEENMASIVGYKWVRRSVRVSVLRSKRAKQHADHVRSRGEGHTLIPMNATIFPISSTSSSSVSVGPYTVVSSSENLSSDAAIMDKNPSDSEGSDAEEEELNIPLVMDNPLDQLEEKRFSMVQRTVLKVNISCQKCKKQLLRAVSGLEGTEKDDLVGVDKVEVDAAKGTLTVTGNADPYKIMVRTRKIQKTVEIVSIGPPPPPPKPDAGGAQKKPEEQKKPDEKKSEPKHDFHNFQSCPVCQRMSTHMVYTGEPNNAASCSIM